MAVATSKRAKKVFVVDRATWLNAGTLAVDKDSRAIAKRDGFTLEQVAMTPCSELLNPSVGMMCCLGFVANQCGVPKKAMAGVGTPESIGAYEEKLFDVLVEQSAETGGIYNTDLAQSAMTINDDSSLTKNVERETKLKALFKKFGFGIKFTGKYPTQPVRYKE